jgi:hypothetical protein
MLALSSNTVNRRETPALDGGVNVYNK